jgi:hypothetical protein
MRTYTAKTNCLGTVSRNVSCSCVERQLTDALFSVVQRRRRRPPHDDAEVTGKFSSVIEKIKLGGVLTLYNGSYAAFGATFVGHYPYVECILSMEEMWTLEHDL